MGTINIATNPCLYRVGRVATMVDVRVTQNSCINFRRVKCKMQVSFNGLERLPYYNPHSIRICAINRDEVHRTGGGAYCTKIVLS